MSKIVDLLLKQAETIRESDTEAMIRSTMSELTASGMAFEKAASLVEQESTKIEDSLMVQILEKTASYISGLEKQAEELQIKISERSEATSDDTELRVKLASAGYSEEEITAMESAPSLMTKVASAAQEPWELGKGIGMKKEKTDPFLDFLTS
jgi:hypothetical protein